jgi:hypothetical protein
MAEKFSRFPALRLVSMECAKSAVPAQTVCLAIDVLKGFAWLSYQRYDQTLCCIERDFGDEARLHSLDLKRAAIALNGSGGGDFGL